MKYTFSRALRLTTSEQFKNVFHRAKKTSTELYAVFYCYNNFGYPRLGVIASKKNIKLAVRRVFFKRLIRESFRLWQHKVGAIDIVFIAYKTAGTISKKKLWGHLEKLWAKLVLL